MLPTTASALPIDEAIQLIAENIEDGLEPESGFSQTPSDFTIVDTEEVSVIQNEPVVQVVAAQVEEKRGKAKFAKAREIARGKGLQALASVQIEPEVDDAIMAAVLGEIETDPAIAIAKKLIEVQDRLDALSMQLVARREIQQKLTDGKLHAVIASEERSARAALLSNPALAGLKNVLETRPFEETIGKYVQAYCSRRPSYVHAKEELARAMEILERTVSLEQQRVSVEYEKTGLLRELRGLAK